MIVDWKTIKEECPLTVQMIEKETGFKYSVAYRNLLDEKNQAVRFEHIEKFFDDAGWITTIYPTDYPNWNGTIVDTHGKTIFFNAKDFEEVKSRPHAKSKLLIIAMKYYEEVLKEMLNEKLDYLKKENKIKFLTKESLDNTSSHVEIGSVSMNNIQLFIKGDCEDKEVVVFTNGQQDKVIKSPYEFPGVGDYITI